MAYLTQYLDTIRGYRINEDTPGNPYKFYDPLYYPFNTVRDAIVTVLNTLMLNKYSEVDISNEIETIQTATRGPAIRNAIYDAIKKFLSTTNIVAMTQITEVRYAHYGSDMREPLYDILIALGADDIGLEFTTKDNKAFYTSDQNKYCVIKKVVDS